MLIAAAAFMCRGRAQYELSKNFMAQDQQAAMTQQIAQQILAGNGKPS